MYQHGLRPELQLELACCTGGNIMVLTLICLSQQTTCCGNDSLLEPLFCSPCAHFWAGTALNPGAHANGASTNFSWGKTAAHITAFLDVLWRSRTPSSYLCYTAQEFSHSLRWGKSYYPTYCNASHKQLTLPAQLFCHGHHHDLFQRPELLVTSLIPHWQQILASFCRK